MKLRQFGLPIVWLLIFSFVFVQCENNEQSSPEQKASDKITISAESLEAAQIVVEPASGGEIVRTLALLGEIKPNKHNSVKITAGVGGVVREFYAKDGDEVQSGNPLALLESREAADLSFSFLELQQRVSFARQTYEREKTLMEKQLGTREALTNALQEYQKTQLDLSSITRKMQLLGLMDEKGKLKKTGSIHLVTLSSPISGTIVARHPVIGEYVEAYRELFSIVDLSSVWVEVQTPLSLASQLRIGQSVHVFSRDIQTPQRAVVIFISPLADKQTRMVPVRLLLANSQRIWRPGACVTAEFVTLKKSVPVRLPRAALQEIEGAFVVFIEESTGIFTIRRVIPGESDEQFVEISQVNPGERVVVQNALSVKGLWLAREQ